VAARRRTIHPSDAQGSEHGTARGMTPGVMNPHPRVYLLPSAPGGTLGLVSAILAAFVDPSLVSPLAAERRVGGGLPVPTPPLPATAIAEDAQLVAACRRGEAGSIEQLVARFQHDVFAVALRLVHDRETALELANAVFFKVHLNLDAYDPTRPLRPWLLRIATNEALNWLRSRRREREQVLGGEASDVALAQLPAAGAGDDPEAAVLAAERRDQVRAALARLPEHYRLVLTLRFFHDLSYQEIAEQTGQDANTVGVQLLRARQLLKRELLRSDEP
jgi:RNA polymerase sigma-70 factor (ECF subfamily)